MTKKSPKAAASAPAKKPAASKASSKAAPTPAAPEKADKIAKAQIVELMSERAGLTKRDAGLAMDAVLDVMVDALKTGKSVGLPGLGTFSVRATAARTGVRPGTSEKIQIPAGKKVGFKVASDLKSSI